MVLAAILTLLIWFPVSTSKIYQRQVIWKVNFLLVSCLWAPVHRAEAAAPPEEAAKLKEKIEKGKVLLQELTDLLKDFKETMKKSEAIEKEKLSKVMEIKDNFQALKMDTGDLSKDLLEEFKDRTLEAFRLMMKTFNIGEMPIINILEETKDFDDSSNTLARRFAEEL